MSILWWIVIFSTLSGVLSLVGGVILLGRTGLVKKFSVHFLSFAAGTLLGGALLDLLPEAVELSQSSRFILLMTLLGIVLFFLIERLIYRFHVHVYEEGQEEHRHATPVLILLGDGIHNFLDGVIIASAFLVDLRLGVISALAVMAHELPQEISDFSIMLHHNWNKTKVFWANFGVSLANLLGGLLTFAAKNQIEPALAPILALTSGIFIYIATSDLFPEISPSISRDKTWHVLGLLGLGIFVVWMISFLFK